MRNITFMHTFASVSAFFISLTLIISASAPLYASAAINNPGFEDGESGWSIGYASASTTASWAVTQTDPHTGSNAGELIVEELDAGDDAKLIFTPALSVTPDTEYTFSTWYRSDVASEIGAYTADGNYAFWIGSTEPVTKWTQFSRTMAIPSSVTSPITFGHAISTVGTITTDDYSLTLVDQSQNAFPEGMVTLTFDDGWKSIYNNAIPALGGIKSTQFIYTNAVSGGFPAYMTPGDLQELKAAGHEIAAHSLTHTDLTTLDETEMAAEIDGSKQYLESVGLDPVTFAYPEGAYDERVVNAVKNAGFAGARTTEETVYNDTATDHFLLNIKEVKNTTSPDQVKTWIDEAVQQKKWLILMYHEVLGAEEECVGANGSGSYTQWCSKVEDLSTTVQHITNNKIKTVTVAQGLELMGADVPTLEDTTAPVVTEVTPVPATTTDATPDYTFNTTEAGPITYGGSCTSATTNAIAGNNTIAFNTLALGTYNDCTITVTDTAPAANASTPLTLSAFEIVATSSDPIVCAEGTHNDGTGTCVADEEPEEATSTPVVVTPSRGGGGSLLNPDRSTSRTNTDEEETVSETEATSTVTVASSTLTRTSGSVLGVATFRFQSNLGSGARGNDVVELQKRLKAEGFFTFETATGYFGPITTDAVKAYQRKHGLPETGFVGPMTREKLNSTLGSAVIEKDLTKEQLSTLVQLLISVGVIRKEKVEAALKVLEDL